MKKHLFIGLFLTSFVSLKATHFEAHQSVFDNANQLQQEGKFQEALPLYLIIETTSTLPSSTLFYNMGNCYYQLEEWAYARAYFEKALKLAPMDDQTITNLNLTLKEIEGPTYKKIHSTDNPLRVFTQHRWLLFILLFVLCFIFSFLIFKFNSSEKIRKLFLTFSILSGLLFFISFTGYVSYFFEKQKAIIALKSDAYESPIEKSLVLKVLDSGQKVLVLDKIKDWVQIQQGENKFWVKSNGLIEI